MQTLKENKTFLVIIIASFAFFAFVLLLGGRLINSNGLIVVSLVIFGLYSCFIVLLSHKNLKKHRELEATQKAIIFSLANLAEWRDPETGYHLERTRNYGVILARQLSSNHKYGKVITDRFVEDLYNAAPLHDMGKVGIRDSILLKEGKLTAWEFEEMKKHVVIGRDILDEIIEELKTKKQFLVMSRNIAAYHHEKYNGNGYPEQLKNDAIPLEARIYALCDAYDAIRSKRPYKEPVTHEEAVKRIVDARGEHFDPDVVEAFLNCDKEFMEVYETYNLFVEKYVAVSDTADHKDLRVRWTKELSVGITEVDNQHQELISRINSLLEAIIKGRGKEEISKTVRFLEDYIVMHFGAEEAYMLQHNYAGYTRHLALHKEFIDKVNSIKKDLAEHGTSSETVIELNKHVVEWLIDHISIEDKAFGRFLHKEQG